MDDQSASEIDDLRDPAHVQDPPTGFVGTLKQLGPGLIIAGSIVGSGELIATTKTGAQAGIALLWLIIFGCVIKVFAQIEMGRYTITHGETALASLNRVPGKLGPANWIVWFWFLMMIVGIAQLGGIVGGVGQAAAIAFPITGDYAKAIELPSEKQIQQYLERDAYAKDNWRAIADWGEAEQERAKNGYRIIGEQLESLGERGEKALAAVRAGEAVKDPYTFDDKYWAAGVAVFTSILLFYGRYGLIQSVTTALVVSFTFITIGNVISLQYTTVWHLSLSEVGRGLALSFPSSSNAVSTAFAAFGIIGVGSAELVAYPYWCLEKGYAKYTGPREQTDSWLTRAKGWIRVMHYDAYLSMLVYTVATIAFYLVGVAVLFREGSDPESMRMVSTLATAYVPIFGEYARWLFLLGAIAVLYSTFMVANASHARMYTDFLKLLGLLKRGDQTAHDWSVGLFGIILPLLCLLILCLGIDPVEAVLLAGLMQGLLLPMVGIGTLYFRYQFTDPRLKPSPVWDALLILSTLAFIIVAGWTVATKGVDLVKAITE